MPRTDVQFDEIRQISENLLLKSYIPREFSRKCRSLTELERWKATEFRLFLLYIGIVALKGPVSCDQYRHFLLLFIAIYIVLQVVSCGLHMQSMLINFCVYSCNKLGICMAEVS